MSLSAATLESLARYWAGKLGDEVDVTGEFDESILIHAPIADNAEGDTGHWFYANTYLSSFLWLTAAEYLSCKNVAGRVLDWATTWLCQENRYEVLGIFRVTAWTDTPQALHDIALACGWEAPK